jgi:hypothetical protein
MTWLTFAVVDCEPLAAGIVRVAPRRSILFFEHSVNRFDESLESRLRNR